MVSKQDKIAVAAMTVVAAAVGGVYLISKALASPPTPTQTQTADVTVLVQVYQLVGPEGDQREELEPAPGIQVIIAGISQTTNSDGIASFQGLPVGTQPLQLAVGGNVFSDDTVNLVAGQNPQITLTLNSIPTPVTSLPTVSVSADPTSGVTPLTVQFTSTVQGGVPPYSYLWNFGDGSTSTSANPSHTYDAAGTFYPIVKVTDSNGNSDEADIEIVVTGAGVQNFGVVASGFSNLPLGGICEQIVNGVTYHGGTFKAQVTVTLSGHITGPFEYTVAWNNGLNTKLSSSSETVTISQSYCSAYVGEITGGTVIVTLENGNIASTQFS